MFSSVPRNAALQLSGTLIPKLVGQKKTADEEASRMSVEAFFSHFPELTGFILSCLQEVTRAHHMDLIPVLCLLSKLSCGVTILIDSSVMQKVYECRNCLLQLLGSPVYQVRKLAAKSYVGLVPHADACRVAAFLADELKQDQNMVSGILLALRYLVRKLRLECKNKNMESQLQEIYKLLSREPPHNYTYFNKLLYHEFMDGFRGIVHGLELYFSCVFEEVVTEKTLDDLFQPGVSLYITRVVETYVETCDSQGLVEAWHNATQFLKSHPQLLISCFTSVRWRVENDKTLPESSKLGLLAVMLRVLSETVGKYPVYVLVPLFDAMIQLLRHPEVNVEVTEQDVLMFQHNVNAFPLMAALFSYHLKTRPSVCIEDIKFSLQVIKIIEHRSKTFHYNEEYRLDVARSVYLLAPCFQKIFVRVLRSCQDGEVVRDIVVIILNVLLDLLQDEDVDVRKEAARCVVVCLGVDVEQNPYTSLRNILNPSTLLSLLPVEIVVEFLWDKLCYTDQLQEVTACQQDKHTNPFDMGVDNIYSEEIKLINLTTDSLLSVLRQADVSETRRLKEIILNMSCSFQDDSAKILSTLDKIQKCK